LIILATIASVGLSLACSPAMAEEPQAGSSTTAIQTAQNTVVPLPTTIHHGRLSTRDRWRGKPYLRSSADETLRSHALDVALPPANSAFQGGVSLQPPGTLASEHAVRTEALDKALPPANSAFVGGSTGGFGF
jgi:hypothetical protein